jgi:hypothetical protein
MREDDGRRRLTDEVVDGSPDKIESDLAEDTTREVESSDDVEKIGPHEDDVGCFYGDIGSGAEGDSNVCDCESWGVVDPISDLPSNLHQ